MTDPTANIAELQQEVGANPGSPRYPTLAAAFVSAGRYEEAIGVAGRGLEVNPLPEGRFVLAEAQLMLGRNDDAAVEIQAGLALRPGDPVGLRLLGDCHLRSGEPDRAKSVLEQAMKANPADPRTRELLASLGGAADPPELELDLGTPPAEEAGDGPAGAGGDMELDLGTPGEGVAAEDPPPAPPVPTPAPGAHRGRSGTARRVENIAAVRPPAGRGPLLIKLGAVGLVIALGIGGYIGLGSMKQAELEALLADARELTGQDTSGALRLADETIEEALELDPEDPDALSLGAYVAARLFTAFDGGTNALVMAEERIASADLLPTVPAGAVAARSMLDLKAERPGDVILAVAKGLADHPNDPMLLWVRAQAASLVEKPDLALSILEQVYSDSPQFLPATITYAELLARLGKKRDSVQVYRVNLERHPHHVGSLIGLARAARSGRAPVDDALAAVEAAKSALSAAASPTELCRLYLTIAQLAVAKGRPDAATAAEDAAGNGVSATGCRIRLGRHLIRRARLSPGSDILASASDDLASSDPAQATRLRREAALGALQVGRYGRASELLDEAPDDRHTKVVRARILLAEGKVEDAGRMLQPLIKGKRADARALAAAAEVFLAAGDQRAASRAAARAARAAKRDPVALTEAGRALLAVGNATAAGKVLRRATRRSKEPSYLLLTLAGRALSGGRNPKEGYARLEQAIRLNPEVDAAVMAYLQRAPPERVARFLDLLPAAHGATLAAEAALYRGALDDAKEQLARAKEEGAVGPRPEGLTARIALLEGKPGSLEALKDFARTNRSLPSAQVALAEAYLHLARFGAAVESFDEALRLDPTLGDARAGRAEAHALGASNPGAALRIGQACLDWVNASRAPARVAGRAHASVAIACAALSDRACAKKEIAAARKLAATHPRVLLAEGFVLAESGNANAALEVYRRAAKRTGGEEALLRIGLLAIDGSVSRADGAKAMKEFLVLVPAHAQASRAKLALAELN